MLKDFIKQIKSGNYSNINSFLTKLKEFLLESIISFIKKNNIPLNEQDIEDIVQDILVKVCQNDFSLIKNIIDIDKSPGYFFSMVRNFIFSNIKENKRFEPIDKYENENENSKTQKEEKFIFKGDHTDYLVAEEVLTIFKDFLSSIKNKTHKIIFLKKLNGYQPKDIEKKLKVSISNINTVFSRIKSEFVRFLNENNLNNIEDEILKNVTQWFLSCCSEVENKVDEDKEDVDEDKKEKYEVDRNKKG